MMRDDDKMQRSAHKEAQADAAMRVFMRKRYVRRRCLLFDARLCR